MQVGTLLKGGKETERTKCVSKMADTIRLPGDITEVVWETNSII